MANKTSKEPAANIDLLLTVMSHISGEISVDWNGVAKEIGIGYGRNAASKFKSTVQKHRYKFECNVVSKDDVESEGNGHAAPSTPPKTPVMGKIKKDDLKQASKNESTKPVAKKRKLELDREEHAETTVIADRNRSEEEA